MASLTQWTWIWTNSRRRWSLAYCNPWSCKEPDNSNNIPYLLPFGSIWDIWTCSVASLPLLESVLNQKCCRCGINCERSIFLAAPKPSVFFSWHGINPEWMIRLVFNLFGNFFFMVSCPWIKRGECLWVFSITPWVCWHRLPSCLPGCWWIFHSSHLERWSGYEFLVSLRHLEDTLVLFLSRR